MIKALLFDYGGTLDTCGVHWFRMLREAWSTAAIVPSEELARNAYVYAERKLGETGVIAPDDSFRIVLKKKLYLELIYLRDHACEGLKGKDLATEADRMAEELDGRVRKNLLAVRPMLQRLHQHFRLVLVSNFYGNLSAVLHNYDISDFFETVIESAAVGLRKPDSAIWKLGVEATGCSPEQCLAIGDSLKNDILPAASIGCRTMWLNPTKALEKGAGCNCPSEFMVRDYCELERKAFELLSSAS